MSADRPTGVVVAGHDLNTTTPDGVERKFEKITGWHEPARLEVIQEQRVNSPGQFAQPGRRVGRLISITGSILAADRALIPDEIDRLNAVLADGSLGVFEFTDRTQGTRTANVQLGPNGVRGQWDGSPTFAYQLELLAPLPFKYGSTSSDSTGFATTPVGSGLVFNLFPSPGSLDFGVQGTTGLVTVTNLGNSPAPVLFSVAGPTPTGGFTITDQSNGKTITYLGAVPTGSVLVLDGATGSVVIDGTADRSGDTLVQAWPAIPAGGSSDFLFSPLGASTAATLTATAVATYL